MKRIAFFQDNLDVGGIQKSLVNLLRNFDYENYEVDLYLSQKKSFWNIEFPTALNIKYLKPVPRFCSFIPFDTARKLVKIDFGDVKEYDLAVDFNSYQFSCALGALSVPAKRRVMWIHNNVSVKLQNEWKYRVLWRNFKDKFKYYDAFVGVSKGVIQPFKECSGMHDKPFEVIQNTIDTAEIFEKAAAEVDFQVDKSKMNFVAIGRLCHQKAYDIMLDVFSEASSRRNDLHLYIIGDGEKRFSLEYMRDSMGLTDMVTFLGQKTNPFCYMDKMDAFVSTSRYEGQPLNIMEAKALGLPLYCTKNLEQYSEGLEGREDIVSAIVDSKPEKKCRDDLKEYNAEIIRRIKLLAEPHETPEAEIKKKVSIIALHLGTGGVEKAIISMANLFAERYDVWLYSVYNLPGAPAFPLDPRVKVKYLIFERPNRQEWKAAVYHFKILKVIEESLLSVRVLIGKKLAVIRTIKSIDEGVLICTRHEDNVELSRYGSSNVLKIAQLHHDLRLKKKYVRGIADKYKNIDVLAMLTPGLAAEAEKVLRRKNSKTLIEYIPNFIEKMPEDVDIHNRDKIAVSVGRATEIKRFDLLIRQFSAMHSIIPDWKLHIIGDGELLPELQEQVIKLKCSDYIILTGRKNGDEVEEEMRRASLYLMSSRSEGLPFVLMEAQSCALPILAYDVRVGPRAVVHDTIDGYLIPEGNEALYGEKLVELCSDVELREKMAVNALASVQQFSRGQVGSKWFALLGGDEYEK